MEGNEKYEAFIDMAIVLAYQIAENTDMTYEEAREYTRTHSFNEVRIFIENGYKE